MLGDSTFHERDHCVHGHAPHRCDRRIVIIGEAWGEAEQLLGQPFVGKAGALLSDWLEFVGWNRTDVYITNVVQRKPAPFSNDIAVVPHQELEEWIDKLHTRLATLADPWVIVPLGNTALRALTRDDPVMRKATILNYRGSILEYVDRNGRRIKVIPTIHPAAVMRQPYWEKRVVRDWKRIKEESAFREIRLPKREHIIHPKFDDIAQFADEIKKRRRDGILSVDIETDPPTNRMLCIAFSYDPKLGMTLPLEGADSPYKRMCWAAAKAFCEAAIAKVLQNGSFDRYHLYFNGINLRRYEWDTMDLHSLIDANEDHNLAFLVSIYTKERYYKSERKEGGTGSFDWETFLTYNSKDACGTREVLDGEMEEARREEVIFA